jgi:hypothetical protein
MKSLNEVGAAFAWQANAIERLAALAHEQWSGWMRYLFSKCVGVIPHPEQQPGVPEVAAIPPDLEKRWQRQLSTPYADLPEHEKESDRIEARKVLALLVELLNATDTPRFDIKVHAIGGATITCDCPPPASWETGPDGLSTCTCCGSKLVVGERHISIIPGKRA